MTTIFFSVKRAKTTVGVILSVVMFMLMSACDDTEQIEQNIRDLRAAAEKLCENPQDKQSLSLLVNQLKHRHPLYRGNAAAVLGEAADQVGSAIAAEAVPALAKLLDEGEWSDQREAASALVHFGEAAQPAFPVLKKRLVPNNRDVAWFSARAIGNIGPPAADAVPELIRAVKEQVDGCSGSTSLCCSYFIPAIGKMGPAASSATPELEALLDRSDPFVRIAAAIALLRIDDRNQRAYEEIARLLKNAEDEVRYETLSSLDESKSAARTVKSLIESAKQDANEDVRQRAGELLRELN